MDALTGKAQEQNPSVNYLYPTEIFIVEHQYANRAERRKNIKAQFSTLKNLTKTKFTKSEKKQTLSDLLETSFPLRNMPYVKDASHA